MKIGYARVSSREQADNSHALEQQIERLKQAGAEVIYSDVESGSRPNRRSLLELLKQAKFGVVSVVIVTRLDRLSRSLPYLRKVIDDLHDAGVGLVALDDSINTTTAAGKFQINILGALAEMETDRLAERVKHGWSHLRSRKVAMNPPFGYVKINDRHELDHQPFLCLLDGQKEMSSVQIARDIVETYLEKKTLRLALRTINERYGIYTFANNEGGHHRGGRVAQRMFRFSVGGFRAWLTNPVLQGHLSYLRGADKSKQGRAEIHYDTHPEHRLISDAEAQAILDILAHNRQVKGFGSTALKYPLSGLVFCAECRASCYSLSGANNYHKAKKLGIQPDLNYYFQCKNWRVRACSQKSIIRMEVAEAAVIEALIQRAEAIATIADTPEQAVESPELKALRHQLAQLEAIPGDNPAIVVAIANLRQQIIALQHKQQQQLVFGVGERKLLLDVFSDPLYWETLESTEKQQIYRALVDRVVIKDGAVVVVNLKV